MTAFASLLVLAAISASDETVLVQFTSQHCTHCQAMQPVLERMAGEGCPVQVIDVDQQPDVARQFQITGVPTFVVLTRGQETGRILGSASYDKLLRLYRGTALPEHTASAPAGTSRGPASEAQSAPSLREDAPTPAQPKYQPALVAERGPAQHYQVQREARVTSAGADPQAAALAASVRLKVEDATGIGCGTGTIIDVHDNEALVVTCGHLFRESQGKGSITAEMFAPGATQPVPGQLIAYDLDRDIALVSIRPGMQLSPAIIAPPGTIVRPQDGAFSVGCDKGAAASVRETRITAVNKYRGKPNFTAAGAPVDGRSGGGLFTAEGMLIGICNAADPADDEGLYAALASIHWQLDQIGQSEIYQRAAQANAAGLAAADQPATTNQVAPAMPNVLPERAPIAAAPAAGPAITPAVYQPAAAPAGVAPVGFESVAPADDDTEIVFIVRSKSNPQQRSEVFVVDGATSELVTRITDAARTTGQRRAAAQAATRETAAGRLPLQTAQRQPRHEAPVVRGQSTDY